MDIDVGADMGRGIDIGSMRERLEVDVSHGQNSVLREMLKGLYGVAKVSESSGLRLCPSMRPEKCDINEAGSCDPGIP